MGPIGSIRDLLQALWRKALLILAVLAIGLPLVVWTVAGQERIFEATAIIQIEAPEIMVTTNGHVQGMTADGQLDLITQTITARDNLAELVEEMNLFPGLPSLSERIGALRSSMIIAKLIDPNQAWRPEAQPLGLIVTARLDDPVQSADLANAILGRIIEEGRARSEGRATRTLEFLTAREAEVSTRIAEIEAEIADFRGAFVASLPEGLTAQRDRATRLTEQQLEIERQQLELAGARDRLRAEDMAAQESLLARQMELIARDLAQVRADIAAAPDVERQLTALSRQLDQSVAELTVLTTQRTEAATNQRLSLQEQDQRFVVLETAVPPPYPVSASRKKLAMAGGIFVVAVALGLALGLEIMRPAIRNAAQMERLIGVQPVIVVPRLESRRRRIGRRLGWSAAILAVLAALAAAAWRWGKELAELAGGYLGQQRAARPSLSADRA